MRKTLKKRLLVKAVKSLVPAYVAAATAKKYTMRRRLFLRLLRKL